MPKWPFTLTVVPKRVLAARRPAEDRSAGPAVDAARETFDPVAPDVGERRLGWLVAAIAIVAVMILAATLTSLPGLRGSAEPSGVPGAPAASWAGRDPVDRATPGPAGSLPTGPVAAPSAGGGGDPAAAPPAVNGPGRAPTPAGPAATTAPGATAGPATTTPAATGGSGADLLDVQTAIADLSAEIRRQVDAGQLDPTAGSDLQSKVQQVAREVSDGDWSSARYYAGRIRDKLDKYRYDGLVTSTGYQALISRLDVLDDALSTT